MQSMASISQFPTEPSRSSTRETYGRRLRRLIPLVAGAALLVVGKIALSGHLLINFTPSIPQGFYWISTGVRPERGDLVTFPIPESVRAVVYDRHYVPRSIRLLAKPVAAIGGDEVCLREHQLLINGHVVGSALDVDQNGNPMPQYAGCGRLHDGELFVSTRHDNSFDSRYFGPIEISVVRGTLTALITF
jgi:conjugative transfer signal peptidase TraF